MLTLTVVPQALDRSQSIQPTSAAPNPSRKRERASSVGSPCECCFFLFSLSFLNIFSLAAASGMRLKRGKLPALSEEGESSSSGV